MPSRKRGPRSCRSPPRVRDAEVYVEKPSRKEVVRSSKNLDMTEIQEHYEALENSKLGILTHVASQHSVLDVLYGGDNCRPMPSWTYQTTPEISVSDQQHTGRCWIFATLAVLGHVFRSQYGISNQRATFSEGYLGFWDLYEKSRLFLQVAYDTRCVPLDDPSLCDLLKGGVSDGGDYIFCLNLLDRYGVVPTEYYPNSSYGSMSTEALVTLLNQVLRDNVITLRTTGDEGLISSMLTNVFTILCMGLGTPPAPWKKLDWQIDQCETMAQFATEISPTPQQSSTATETPSRPQVQSASLPAESVPWRVSEPKTYPVTVPPKREVEPKVSSSAQLLEAIDDVDISSPVESTATAAPAEVESLPSPSAVPAATSILRPLADDEELSKVPRQEELPSSTTIVEEELMTPPSEPKLSGLRAPRPVIDIPTRESSRRECVDVSSTGICKRPGGFARILQRITPQGCEPAPLEGSGSFFRETMPDSGCLLGKPCQTSACRLSHTIESTSPRGDRDRQKRSAQSEEPRREDALSFDYTPRDFYYRFLTSVKFVPVVCDPRFPTGTRIISNDANMYGGLPSTYLNVTIDDIEAYTVASLKRNIPVWFACDVKKHLTPEGGRMCNHTDRLNDLLPIPHAHGTKLQEIRHFNAIANHALLISAVSIKAGKPIAWRIVNSWGDVGRHAGVFVACGDWFREHVYAINAVYDTLSREHKQDADLHKARPTVRLGPFDPSVI